MAELQGKKRQQPSSCPEGYLPAAIVVQLELTRRQERYARRAVGIARFVYNRLVANDQANRDAGLWLTPHELEKEFNTAKRINSKLAFGNRGEQVRGPRGLPQLPQRPLPLAGQEPQSPQTHLPQEEPYRHRLLPRCLGCGPHQIRRPPPRPPAILGQREDDSSIAGRHSIRGHHQEAQRTLVRRRRLLEAACRPAPARNSIGGRGRRGHQPLGGGRDSTEYENPKAYYAAQRRLKRWQHIQARRKPSSRGWWEAQRRIDAIHRRITGLRNNLHHQVSLALVRKYHTLGIESLNVADMIRAGLQSRDLSDAGISTLLNQICYKSDWYGTRIVEADRWYPSSKTCSACGKYNAELDRQLHWSCPGCGVIHDRNLNAARNL